MLMLMKTRALAVVATMLAATFVASPSMAGTVWGWTTEDGTAAYTNDPKRIPAKYKDAAARRTIGALKNYPRLTESDVTYKTPYAERVQARLEKLRGPEPAVSAGPPGIAGEHPVTIDVGVGNAREGVGDQISIPVGTRGDEPIETEVFTVRLRGSIATRTVQITRQGDEILAMRIGQQNPRKINQRTRLDAAAAEALGTRLR